MAKPVSNLNDAAAYFNEADYPANFHPNSYFSQPGRFRGGSGIISPSGSYLAGPVFDQETIVYGEIDLADCDRARHSANLAGLYHRWDLFQLQVQEREPTPTHPLSPSRPLIPTT